MANMQRKVKNVKIVDYSQMATTQAGAAAGGDNFIDEIQIYKPAFENVDAEIFDDETVRLSHENNDGSPDYVSWTTIDAIDTGENQTTNSTLSERQTLTKQLTEITDMHDAGSISDSEYNTTVAEIKKRLLELDLASYTDLHDSGQMSDEGYNAKAEEIKSQISDLQNTTYNRDGTYTKIVDENGTKFERTYGSKDNVISDKYDLGDGKSETVFYDDQGRETKYHREDKDGNYIEYILKPGTKRIIETKVGKNEQKEDSSSQTKSLSDTGLKGLSATEKLDSMNSALNNAASQMKNDTTTTVDGGIVSAGSLLGVSQAIQGISDSGGAETGDSAGNNLQNKDGVVNLAEKIKQLAQEKTQSGTSDSGDLTAASIAPDSFTQINQNVELRTAEVDSQIDNPTINGIENLNEYKEIESGVGLATSSVEIAKITKKYLNIFRDNYHIVKQTSIDNGSIVLATKEGEKPRIYTYNQDGIAAITQINTDNVITDISYNDGVVTATFENSGIKTFRIDENGNLVAFGFNGGRQNYEDATDVQKRLVDIASNPSAYNLNTMKDNCWGYVNDVFFTAGIMPQNHLGSATLEMYEIRDNWGLSTDFSNIPVGAAIFTDHSWNDDIWVGGYSAGHVGIYIGNGMVRHNVGGVKVQSLDEWISERRNNAPSALIAWGWPNGVDLANSDATTNIEITPIETVVSNIEDIQTNDDNQKLQQNLEIVRKNVAHGQDFHQVQGNGANCGATAAIVSVNTLLGENKYTDNVGEWNSAAFGGNSTVNLTEKSIAWLKEKGLDDKIECVDGSYINSPEELKNELESGHVVVSSTSGTGNVFQYTDGSPFDHSAGHFISFYKYEDGKYYANDSSLSSGAGVTYNENQMQTWFDARPGRHPGTIFSLK